MGLGAAEVDHQAITDIACEVALKALNLLGAGLLVSENHLAQLFRIKLFCERGGAHQVTEHHRKLATLGFRRSYLRLRRCGSCLATRCLPWSLRPFPLAALGGGWLSFTPQGRSTRAAKLCPAGVLAPTGHAAQR